MRTLTAWIIGAVLTVATVAQADSSREQAKKHFAAGMEKFKAGDYRGAIDEFKKADAQVPSPILSYNIGLCHERLGENAQAILLYRSYLERRPDAPNKAEVEKKIAELQAKLDGEKAPPKTEPEPEPPKTEPEPPKTETEPPKTETPKTETPKTETPRTETPRTETPVGSEPPIDDDEPRFSPQPPPTGTVERPKPQPRPRVAQKTKTTAQKRAARPAPPPDQPKKAKPIYKKWWFWVVVGVSAYVLIDVATADSPNSQSSGLVLFRF